VGRQAKYISDIGSLLGAMTTTVRRVAEERPDLRRLTFCIPTNLSSGTVGGTRTPDYTRYERRVASWKEAIAGAEKIEFVLKQGR
jgi:hypothetical protein